MTETTAVLNIRPAEGAGAAARCVLREGFRPVWRHLAAPPARPSSVLAGGVEHQLAHGLLCWLWAGAPAALAADPALARLVGWGRRGAATLHLTDGDAGRVYAAAAGLADVDLTLLPGTGVRGQDVRTAVRAGLDVGLVDARGRRARA